MQLIYLLLLSISYAQEKPVIGLIDTGVDCSHSKIRCISNGWDFTTNAPTANIDNHSHGTHVAGIMLQNAPTALILPVKYYSLKAKGRVNLQNEIKAIKFAIDQKVDIINISGGGPEFFEEEYQILKKAEEQNILVIVAAGNENENIDILPYYPAAYHLKNMIVVGALGVDGKKLKSSNYGSKVDIFVLGENINSTLPNNKSGVLSGTSMACAMVSGLAAKLISKKTTNVVELKKQVLKSLDIY